MCLLQTCVVKMFNTDCKREEDRHERLARRADMYALTCTVTDEVRPDPEIRERRAYLSQVWPKQQKFLPTFLSPEGNAVLSSHAANAIKISIMSTEFVDDAVFNSLRVYRCAVLDYGTEKVRYVAHSTYRARGSRFDNVEVNVTGVGYAAKVLFFVSSRGVTSMAIDGPTPFTEQIYAVVQYYDIVKAVHPIMKRPKLRLSIDTNAQNFHFISIDAINKHAHLIPDFDDPTKQHYFWDKQD